MVKNQQESLKMTSVLLTRSQRVYWDFFNFANPSDIWQILVNTNFSIHPKHNLHTFFILQNLSHMKLNANNNLNNILQNFEPEPEIFGQISIIDFLYKLFFRTCNIPMSLSVAPP